MFLDVLRFILFFAFIVSSLFLIVIILLQEGKGGGLAGAFGGMGGETFGVGSGGINKATSILATVFIVCAVILGATHETSVAPESDKPVNEQSAGDSGDNGSVPVDGPEKTPVDQPEKDPD